MDWQNCQECNYPNQGTCGNPACPSNPSLTEERKQALRAAHAKREAQRQEREMLARARARAMKQRS